METYRIAAMGADGIGPEVVDAAVQALKVCAERDGGFKLDFRISTGARTTTRSTAS